MSDGQRLGLFIDGVDIYKQFGIKVKDRKIGKPNKKKILETVPFSSNVLDFSELYGDSNYEERVLQYTLNIKGSQFNRSSAYFVESEFNNFIMDKIQFTLIDEIYPGYYFKAEVRQGTDFTQLFHFGELTVQFEAYPFRIKKAKEGSLFWDDYDISDYYQEVSFTINGSKTIKLLNDSIKQISPVVNCSSEMVITIGNVNITFPKGKNQSFDFVLKKGFNNLVVKGNGTIDFEFHKEVI